MARVVTRTLYLLSSAMEGNTQPPVVTLVTPKIFPGAQSKQIVGLHMSGQPLGDEVGRGVVGGAGQDVDVGVEGHGLASATGTGTKHETLLPRLVTLSLMMISSPRQ